MKIIHTNNPVNAEELKTFLQNKLSPLFKKQRQADIDFVYTITGNGVEITQPDMYEGFLFRIDVVNENELQIIKSEHYVDDVNLLTIESIMNDVFMDYPGRNQIDYTSEKP